MGWAVTETEEQHRERVLRADERRNVLAEVEALIDDFSWTLPLLNGVEINIATDDAACSVQDQIGAAVRKLQR
jgi:hypothetical protein